MTGPAATASTSTRRSPRDTLSASTTRSWSSRRTDLDRRQMIALALAAMTARGATAASAQRTLKAIHERVGGRLGVHILDSQSGKRIGLDDGSRYAMASTFKVPLAA